MNDVGAMLTGMTRTEIAFFSQSGVQRCEAPQPGEFASLLEQYALPPGDCAGGTKTLSGQIKAETPLTRLLTLIKKDAKAEDEDDLPAELAALVNAIESPVPQIDSSDEPPPENDMEVNNALAFTAPEVQDELTALMSRIAGEKESGVFLRILGKIFEDGNHHIPQPPSLSAGEAGPAPENTPGGLLQVLDAMIGDMEGSRGSEVPFVGLPEDFEGFAAAKSSGSGQIVPLLPLLRELRGRISELDVISEGLASGAGSDIVPETGGEYSTAPLSTDTPAPGTAQSWQDGGADSLAENPDSLPKPAKLSGAAEKPAGAVAAHIQPPAGGTVAAEFEPVIQRVNVASLLEQIADSAAASRSEGVTKLEMKLNPEFLGKVSVVLTSGPDGLSATLKSASEATRNLLAENISALQNTLRDMGINMKSIEVTRPEISWDFSRNPNPEQRRDTDAGRDGFGRGDSRESRRAAVAVSREYPAAGGGSIYNSAGAYAVETSIDYRA